MGIRLLCAIGTSSIPKKALIDDKLLPHQPTITAPPLLRGLVGSCFDTQHTAIPLTSLGVLLMGPQMGCHWDGIPSAASAISR